MKSNNGPKGWASPQPILTVVALLLGLAVQAIGKQTNLIDHPFTTGAEGWDMVDLPDGGRFTDLVPPVPVLWTNIVLSSSPQTFIDSSAIDGLQRYYRAIEIP